MGLGVALFRAFLTAPVGVRLETEAALDEDPAEAVAADPPAAAAAVVPEEVPAAPVADVPFEALFFPFFGAGFRFTFLTGAGKEERKKLESYPAIISSCATC